MGIFSFRKRLPITKPRSIVPPVAMAETHLNAKNNSKVGMSDVIIPVTDCIPTAIMSGVFLPILQSIAVN